MTREKTPIEKYEFITKISLPEELEEANSPNVDDRTFAKDSLYSDYRQLAVLEWHLHKDAGKYREYLKTALAYERERFIEVHENNPTIWYHFPGGYAETALLTGDFTYAQKYSAFLDDHHDQKAEIRKPWGYYVKMYLLLGRYKDTLETNIIKLKKTYDTKSYERVRSEYGLYEALVENDTVKFHTNLEQLAKTHKGTGNLFLDYEDRFLCLTGLALSNLAIGLGMKIDFDHPFVPRALLGA
ncbi:MAG: Imm49 family immunity protein [Bacteroidota bacterium]